MTAQEFESLCNEIVMLLKNNTPYDTGNLSNNGVRFEFTGNECHIYVDEAIAPYMPFTNEEWISPRWNGKKNPNEAWWQTTVEDMLLPAIVGYTGGVLKRGKPPKQQGEEI